MAKAGGQPLPYEVVDQVPVSSLALAPHPHTLRDVKPNFNLGLGPPLLGDRVVNVHEVSVLGEGMRLYGRVDQALQIMSGAGRDELKLFSIVE